MTAQDYTQSPNDVIQGHGIGGKLKLPNFHLSKVGQRWDKKVTIRPERHPTNPFHVPRIFSGPYPAAPDLGAEGSLDDEEEFPVTVVSHLTFGSLNGMIGVPGRNC